MDFAPGLKQTICALFEVHEDSASVQRIVTPLEYPGSNDKVVIRVRQRSHGFEIDENGEAALYASTSLKALDSQHAERVEKTIQLRKPHLPPLLIRKRVLRIARKQDAASNAPLVFSVPTAPAPLGPVVQTWSPVLTASGNTHLQRLDAADVRLEPFAPLLDCYTAAARLAASYHLPTVELLAALRHTYGNNIDHKNNHSQRRNCVRRYKYQSTTLTTLPGNWKPNARTTTKRGTKSRWRSP